MENFVLFLYTLHYVFTFSGDLSKTKKKFCTTQHKSNSILIQQIIDALNLYTFCENHPMGLFPQKFKWTFLPYTKLSLTITEITGNYVRCRFKQHSTGNSKPIGDLGFQHLDIITNRAFSIFYLKMLAFAIWYILEYCIHLKYDQKTNVKMVVFHSKIQEFSLYSKIA